MSTQQNIFIKYLVGIAIGLTVIMGGGLASFYNMTIRFEERADERINSVEVLHETNIKSVKDMHNKDIQYIVKDIKQIRLNQQEFKVDQKEVLKILRER